MTDSTDRSIDTIELFSRHLSAREKSKNTISTYADNVLRTSRAIEEKYNLDFSTKNIGKVTGLMLDEFYASMRDKEPSTRNLYVISLKEFFGYAENAQLISSNPSSVLHCVPTKKNKDETLLVDDDQEKFSIETLKKMMDKCRGGNKARDQAMIVTMLATGLRVSELCSLNVENYHQAKNHGVMLVRRKGGRVSRVTVGEYAIPYIELYLEQRGDTQASDPLFLSSHGNRMNRNSTWKTLATKSKAVGAPTGTHRFRHTFLSATSMAAGAAVARDLGGHSSVSITNTYLHATTDERRAAVNSLPWSEVLAGASAKGREDDLTNS